MTEKHTFTPAILIVNCGSSSIKYQLLSVADGKMLAGGLLDRIGEGGSKLHHRVRHENGELAEDSTDVIARNHRQAFSCIAEAMRTSSSLFTKANVISAIGHRVVHGGVDFSDPVLIETAVVDAIRALIPLAPLHNPANLVGIEACLELFPDVPQVAVFDTAFHQSMPARAYRYAVPDEWFTRYGIRRYGFHGTSHRYVAHQAAAFLGRPLATLNIITLHLGNGASAAAIEKGSCIDTSMGFTPMEGLVMGTRCGDLDPAVPLFMQQTAGLSAVEVESLLNTQSGLKGLCGSNDLRELLLREENGDERARLALEIYAYRIKKYVGAYCAVLDEVDAVVFTGGVGENSSRVRSLACAGMQRAGIAVDAAANLAAAGAVSEIGQAGMPVRLLVVRTNEELQMARETLAVVQQMENV